MAAAVAAAAVAAAAVAAESFGVGGRATGVGGARVAHVALFARVSPTGIAARARVPARFIASTAADASTTPPAAAAAAAAAAAVTGRPSRLRLMMILPPPGILLYAVSSIHTKIKP